MKATLISSLPHLFGKKGWRQVIQPLAEFMDRECSTSRETGGAIYFNLENGRYCSKTSMLGMSSFKTHSQHARRNGNQYNSWYLHWTALKGFFPTWYRNIQEAESHLYISVSSRQNDCSGCRGRHSIFRRAAKKIGDVECRLQHIE